MRFVSWDDGSTKFFIKEKNIWTYRMTGILVLCIDEGNGGAIGCYCGEGGLVLLFTNHWESSLWTGAGQCGLGKDMEVRCYNVSITGISGICGVG